LWARTIADAPLPVRYRLPRQPVEIQPVAATGKGAS